MPNWIRTPIQRLWSSGSLPRDLFKGIGSHRVATPAGERQQLQQPMGWLHEAAAAATNRSSSMGSHNCSVQWCLASQLQMSNFLVQEQQLLPHFQHQQQVLFLHLQQSNSNSYTAVRDRRLLSTAGSSGGCSSSTSSSTTTKGSSSASSTVGNSSAGSTSTNSSKRFRLPITVALMNSPHWVGIRRQQERLQRLWMLELQRQQQQGSPFHAIKNTLMVLQGRVTEMLQRLQQAARPSGQQLQQQINRRKQLLQGEGRRLHKRQKLVVERLRRRLRLQQQQLRRQLQQQQSALQEKRLIWAERRRMKLEAALLLLQQQQAHLTAATASAREKLRGLWRRYGWTAVVAYGIVHSLTLLSLFGIASTLPTATLKGAATSVGLGRFVDSESLDSEHHKVWRAAVFAYVASKPLAPFQVALSVWLTPSLARLFGKRIDRLGGRAEAAASSAAGDAAAKTAAAAAVAAAAARRSWRAAKVRRDTWRKNRDAKGPPSPPPPP